jgi:hypothetical protein
MSPHGSQRQPSPTRAASLAPQNTLTRPPSLHARVVALVRLALSVPPSSPPSSAVTSILSSSAHLFPSPPPQRQARFPSFPPTATKKDKTATSSTSPAHPPPSARAVHPPRPSSPSHLLRILPTLLHRAVDHPWRSRQSSLTSHSHQHPQPLPLGGGTMGWTSSGPSLTACSSGALRTPRPRRLGWHSLKPPLPCQSLRRARQLPRSLRRRKAINDTHLHNWTQLSLVRNRGCHSPSLPTRRLPRQRTSRPRRVRLLSSDPHHGQPCPWTSTKISLLIRILFFPLVLVLAFPFLPSTVHCPALLDFLVLAPSLRSPVAILDTAAAAPVSTPNPPQEAMASGGSLFLLNYSFAERLCSICFICMTFYAFLRIFYHTFASSSS